MITKQAINRLLKSDLEVKLWNGCFNVVTATANFSKGRKYELRVEITHPYLEWQCGKRGNIYLLHWQGGAGNYEAIPEELDDLILKMMNVGSMSDEEAKSISDRNKKSYTQAISELGLNGC